MINRRRVGRYNGHVLGIPTVFATVYRQAMDAYAFTDESRPAKTTARSIQSDFHATHCGSRDTAVSVRYISTLLKRVDVPQRDGARS